MALSTEEIWHRIGQITIAYPLLECDKCAISISRWLERWEVDGQILRLKTKRRSEVFITSGRIGGNESITENGTHYGVEVLGKVFDNLSVEGLPREQWIKDFNCRSGQFVVDEVSLAFLLGNAEDE
ncbi:MAG: papain fold toxin domain-containing protein [Cyanobacteria bacterium J06621_11]